jgi:ketosteroid isomerase-like protein
MAVRCWHGMGAEDFMDRNLLSPTGNPASGTPKNVRSAVVAALALILFACAALPAAQKNSKSAAKEAKEFEAANSASSPSLVTLPDAQAIELMLSQMLAAWQIGDEQMLHTFYADDVLVVSGAWEPPLQGWQNYLRAYQAQRARTQGIRMDRSNTFTKVLGTTAWSTYQWEFAGQVDGAQSSAVGQTTLVLEKRAGKWLIVVNHTSVSPLPPRAAPSSAMPNSPAIQPTSSPRAAGKPGA